MTTKSKQTKDTVVLRTEIIESEKARIDLLKYKLITVAALGAVGLGLRSNQSNGENSILQHDYILCIIPLACVYIDLLCYHNTMRILVIGRFLNSLGNEYEKYILKLGDALKATSVKRGADYFFQLEDWSLIWSTVFLSVLIAILGLSNLGRDMVDNLCKNPPVYSNLFKGGILLVTGIVGIVASFITYYNFQQHKERLFKISDTIDKQHPKTEE